MEKISIIIPAYNEEKRINKVIDSLLGQTYKNIEIIIVDDGSTDNTVKIINNYKDKRLKVFSKENGGQGKARNFGINVCTGDYLMFVDADDYVDKNIVKKLYECLKENDADISICNLYKVINGKNVIFKNLEHFTNNDIFNFMMSHPGPVGRLYKKNLFTNNNIEFVSGLINEDLGTIPLLGIYCKKISHIDDALYYYVIHENSTTMQTKYSKKLEDIFLIMEHLDSEFKNRTNHEYDDIVEYLYIEHLLYSSSLKLINFNEGIKQIEKISAIIKNKYPNWRNNEYLKCKSFKFKVVCYLAYYKKLNILKLLKKIKK